MHTISGYENDVRLDTVVTLELAPSSPRVVHVHALDTDSDSDSFGNIVDLLGVVSARPGGVDAALKVGRAHRYPGTHCRTCGAEVNETHDIAREMVSL
jgi:hypothetical protein